MDLLQNTTRNRRANGRLINARDAATELLGQILLFVQGALGGTDDEVIATVPVEAYAFYVDWLRDAVSRQFPRGVTILDEATACILGYQARRSAACWSIAG